MVALWFTAVTSLIVAIAALAYARHTARRLAEVTQMYWALKFEHGELKAKVDPREPAAPQPKQTFVPLASMKKP